jgi:hypothetical protein
VRAVPHPASDNAPSNVELVELSVNVNGLLIPPKWSGPNGMGKNDVTPIGAPIPRHPEIDLIRR